MVFICHELVSYRSCFIYSLILKLKYRSLEITLKSKWIKGPDVADRKTNQGLGNVLHAQLSGK